MFRKFQWIGSSLLMAVILITTASVGNIRSVAQKRNGTKIVATFLPMYMFTKGVTGETGEVEILIPAGADPHEYQSTPENARTIAQADVLVKNGLGLEEFLEKLVETYILIHLNWPKLQYVRDVCTHYRNLINT